MLVTVSEQCDQKIMSIRDEEKQGKIDILVLYYQTITKLFVVKYCAWILVHTDWRASLCLNL